MHKKKYISEFSRSHIIIGFWALKNFDLYSWLECLTVSIVQLVEKESVLAIVSLHNQVVLLTAVLHWPYVTEPHHLVPCLGWNLELRS